MFDAERKGFFLFISEIWIRVRCVLNVTVLRTVQQRLLHFVLFKFHLWERKCPPKEMMSRGEKIYIYVYTQLLADENRLLTASWRLTNLLVFHSLGGDGHQDQSLSPKHGQSCEGKEGLYPWQCNSGICSFTCKVQEHWIIKILRWKGLREII